MTKNRLVASDRLISDSAIGLRLRLWRLVLAVPAEVDAAEFTGLLLEGSYSSWCEISRDTRRTYAPFLRKRPDLHLQLTRILHALAARFRDVGYCQGMNFVAGTVLLALRSLKDPSVLVAPPRNSVMSEDEQEMLGCSSPRAAEHAPDSFMAVIEGGLSEGAEEVVAFKICERVFLRNHFVRTYELGLHMRLTIWTFDKLVESLFPQLHEVVTRDLQVSADFYASSWFITLFSADLDFNSSVRILDLFIGKGLKSLHRFGLACIASQLDRLVGEDGVLDPAEGLKKLRAVACSAVKELGIEALILRSVTEFKCVTNRLVADLQTAGKVHGGAQLMFITDQDRHKKSWKIIPVKQDDSSPSGAALGAVWSKEEAAIKVAQKQYIKSGSSRMSRFLFGPRRASTNGGMSPPSVPAPVMQAGDEEDDEDGSRGLTGASPESKSKKEGSKGRASKVLKSFKKRLGSMMPQTGKTKTSLSGYAKPASASLDDN